MDDLISRQAAIEAVHSAVIDFFDFVEDDSESPITYNDKQLLSINKAITTKIKSLPSAERKKGKWDERSVFDAKDTGIEEMQSAKCSVCGKYHTTPYLYFFDNFNYCPNCGADMRGDTDETD